jgi:hypothetical protein
MGSQNQENGMSDIALSEAKSIFSSKTFWTNVLGPVFLYLATKYGLNLDADTQAQIVLIVMAVANIILRRLTSQPVTILPPKPQT